MSDDNSELSGGLSSLREGAGLPPSEAAAYDAPWFSVNLPLDDLARRIVDRMTAPDGRHGLFNFADEIVTVEINPKTGKIGTRIMTPSRFRTWLPQTRGLIPIQGWKRDKVTGGESIIKGQLTKDQATVVLDNDELKDKIPKLLEIRELRAPVFGARIDDRGFKELRLPRKGFDADTGIYTVGTIEFDEDMAIDDAVTYLHNLFRFFGWREEARDFAIHLAALITAFCRGIYSGKAPAFAYNANMQESGKTTLATYITWVVYGGVKTTPLLKDKDTDLQKLLDTLAIHSAPYLIFDNIDWGNHPVKSELLDQWISNREWEFRQLGGNNLGDPPPLRGLTLMTGNRITLSTDLQRRSLMADLLNALPAPERQLPEAATLIDAQFFENVENRRKALAAVWAMVRYWDEQGRPPKPGRLLGTFEGWSRVVPSIVWTAGQLFGASWDCMKENTNVEVGDKEGAEFKRLAEYALAEFGPEGQGMRERFEITVAQLAGVARRQGVATWPLWPDLDVESVRQTEDTKGGFRYIVPGDPNLAPVGDEIEKAKDRQAAEWLTPKTRSSFGNALKHKLHERHFKAPDGAYYEFVHRQGVTPARYLVTRVKR